MGKRGRRRARADAGVSPAAAPASDYTAGDGGVLTLRDELTPGTLRALERLEATAAASAEDRWQRRVELLFERLAVRWEIAGLPISDQKELLGRYRMASPDERGEVRAAIAAHLRARHPDVEV